MNEFPKHTKPLLLLAPALLLAGCVEVPETIYSACHATETSAWRAEIELRPSAHNRPVMQRFLVVTGKVTVPSGGYSVSLAEGPVERSDPPIQQILIRTRPPGGMATQALTTHDVRAEFPAMRRYGGLTIRCGDGTVGFVKSVEEPAADAG